MSIKIEQAKSLVAQKKFKKALSVLKKVNSGASPLNYEALELEAVCLFNEKKYRLTQIKMLEALKFANSEKQKIFVFNNLAAVSEKLKEPANAIKYLKETLSIDSSMNTAAQRSSLIEYAYSIEDYETIENFAPFLINTTQYSLRALLILSKTAIATQKHVEALTYLSRIDAELRTQGALTVSQPEIVHVLNGYNTIKSFEKESNLLAFLKPQFESEPWFQEIKQRLGQISDSKGGDTIKQKIIDSNAADLPASNFVIGEDKATLTILKKLKILLESMGASFDKNMLIVERQGELAVTIKTAQVAKKPLMNVPLVCMPILEDYKFTLNDKHQLVTTAKRNMINRKALPVMLLLTDLYNAADKLNSWKTSYPLFSLAGFESILDKLLKARHNGPAYKCYYADSKNQISNDLVIKSFIASRTFSFRNSDLRKATAKPTKPTHQGFIPILDLINHNMAAPKFNIDSKQNSLITYTQNTAANTEIFVQYNLDDPLVTLLGYGFVDTASTWIYSVPIVLKCKTGLTLIVKNELNIVDESKLPAAFAGLSTYFPARSTRKGTQVDISKLIIPGQLHQHSLKHILAYTLKSVDLEGIYLDEKTLELEVDLLEKQLVEKNLQYWHELKTMIVANASSDKPMPDITSSQLLELCDFCTNHIKTYVNQTGFVLKR